MNMNTNKYLRPRIAVVDFRVEQGFAGSDGGSNAMSLSPGGEALLFDSDSPRNGQYDVVGGDGNNGWF